MRWFMAWNLEIPEILGNFSVFSRIRMSCNCWSGGLGLILLILLGSLSVFIRFRSRPGVDIRGFDCITRTTTELVWIASALGFGRSPQLWVWRILVAVSNQHQGLM